MARIMPIRYSRRSPETVFVQVFAVTILLGILGLAKLRYDGSWISSSSAAQAQHNLFKRDQECRLVHSQPDKCAFVKENCPDEEAGLISYLRLYYCTLEHAKPLAFSIMVVWISVLFSTIGIAAADFLCLNLSTISNIMHLSESLAGVTLLAFGNGSSDVFSTFAAFSSHSGSLAVGELMGAAGFITAVVAGSMAITKPFRVAKKAFIRDVTLFAIAAGFSLNFLKDGRLKLWECTAMVAFYVFYVIFVVAWHWWFEKRRRTKRAELVARSHLHIPGHQELDVPEIEDDEESRPTAEITPLIRTPSLESNSFNITPGTPAWAAGDVDDIDDETRDQYMAALSNNMRVARPGRDRRNTATPIRPSLIGALEFRSVLSALEKKSTNNRPIYMRRYSDEASNLLAQAGESQFAVSHPELASRHARTSSAPFEPTGPNLRTRAVSTGDATILGASTSMLEESDSPSDLGSNSRRGVAIPQISASPPPQILRDDFSNPQSQALLSPSSISTLSTVQGAPSSAIRNGFLAPPEPDFRRPDHNDDGSRTSVSGISPGGISPGAISPAAVSPMGSVPKLKIPQPGARHSPELRYTDSPVPLSSHNSRPPSIRLPPPSLSPESSHVFPPSRDQIPERRQYTWWPYKYLPAPQMLMSTLFPGLYDWGHKGWPERILAIVTAPSIFLLTITLPVVETKNEEDQVTHTEPQILTPLSASPNRSRASTIVRPQTGLQAPLAQADHAKSYSTMAVPQISSDESDDILVSSPKDWNRWLAMTQCFTAPLFIVAIVWANIAEDSDATLLIKLILGALIFSLTGLGVLITFTTPEHEPKQRPLTCFIGFLVAIAWISTIANEVVGVLKAFGVLLNISDAILGLTVFAVGNSLGDLVADITVARLGLPMMALSACFGGPMLNILLGIGVGGLYQTLTNAHKKFHKHPERPIRYKPYELEINTTLMISGITLLVILVCLLIVVPLNKWRMDRKIGVGLIALWLVSTGINLVLEILGIGEENAESFLQRLGLA